MERYYSEKKINHSIRIISEFSSRIENINENLKFLDDNLELLKKKGEKILKDIH